MTADPGPRARFEHFSPIFPVRDLTRALAHYRSLGFVTAAYTSGDEYGFADRDEIGLHLTADPGHDPATQASGTYLYVDDADALYEEWTRPGVAGLTRRVGDTAYRLREGSHVDRDGNVIRFGSPMPSRPATRLRAHLEDRYGIQVTGVTDLDVGVFLVERADGPSWVARQFRPTRPVDVVAGDADVLRYLAAHEFPAERCATDEPVSVLDGRAVLVTEYVDAVRAGERREAIRAAGGLRRLGDLLGQLHRLPGDGVASRPGGAWHHLADGRPAAELAAAADLLAGARDLVDDGEVDAYRALGEEVDQLDDGDGLPVVFTHPDFVMANVVASRDGIVLVDWAGAGRAPRLWSLAFLLYAEGAKDLRRVDRVVAGYRPHIQPEPDELDRLAAVLRARPLIFVVWAVCTGRSTPTEAVAGLGELNGLTEAIADRARAAFAD